MNRTDKKYADMIPNNKGQNLRTRSTDQEHDLGYVSGDDENDEETDAAPVDLDNKGELPSDDDTASRNEPDADKDDVSNDQLPTTPRP